MALANGLDLELIHEDQNPAFFVGKGIAVGSYCTAFRKLY